MAKPTGRKILYPSAKQRHIPTVIQGKEKVLDENFVAGSEEELKEVERLQDRLLDMQMDFLEFTATGDQWLTENEDELRDRMNGTNEMIQKRMLMMSIMPLSRGVNRQSVGQSLGMMVGIKMMDPTFRQAAKEERGEFWKKIAGGEDVYDTAPAPLREKARKALAKGNYGRVPFSAESAALMEISFSRQVYEKLREPDLTEEDREAVMSQYHDAKEMLHSLAKMDGVKEEDITKNKRVIISRMESRENEVDGRRRKNIFTNKVHGDFKKKEEPLFAYSTMRTSFSEMAYGGVVRGDPSVKYYKGYDPIRRKVVNKEYRVWDGAYKQRTDDGYVDYEGDFTPRPPMSEKDLHDSLEVSMLEQMRLSKIANRTELEKITEIIRLGAMGATQSKDESPYVQHLYDKYKDDPQAMRVASQYANYMQMAQEDGFSEEERADAVMVSLQNAFMKYNKEYPKRFHFEEQRKKRPPNGPDFEQQEEYEKQY